MWVYVTKYLCFKCSLFCCVQMFCSFEKFYPENNLENPEKKIVSTKILSSKLLPIMIVISVS